MRLRDRWRYSATSTRFWNWRNQRARERGRRDAAARAGDQVRSRTPIIRSRTNPATGRPHRDDRHIGRLSDQSLARMREDRAYARYSERAGRLAPRFHPTGQSRGPTVQRPAGRWTR